MCLVQQQLTGMSIQPQRKIGDDVWPVVQEAIDRNTRKRINWKSILGMSLNVACTKFRMAGVPADLAIQCIIDKNSLTQDQIKKLRIGVCARYGEQKIKENAEKEER